MKILVKRSTRRFFMLIIAIAIIIGMNFQAIKTEAIKAKEYFETPVTLYSDPELKENLIQIANDRLDFFYKVSYSKTTEKADIVLTFDLNKLNKEKSYDMFAYSPLLIVMKSSKNLNNLKITKSTGFLTSEKDIKDKNNDVPINCDFSKVVEAVINGKNWDALGGPKNKQIKVYCPPLETVDGQLFKEFIIRTYNNGSKTSTKEIDEKINKFFASPNVIQTDIASKITILGDKISEYDIFVGFENEFKEIFYNQSSIKEYTTFVYPNTTILKTVYVQFNSNDSKLKERFYAEGFVDHNAYNEFYYNEGYRIAIENNAITSNKITISDMNTQDGINAFELN